MESSSSIDGVLIKWGDRLFYPGNPIVRVRPQPRLDAGGASRRAAAIRSRIAATVVRRAPQVMVKVTGGGRGMAAIAAHFRYISKNGKLEMEDELGQKLHGKQELHDLADDWRFGGSQIDEIGFRREAFNIMLSMPRGTDPLSVQHAAREFAKIELADHKYVMVLHDHQANPHMHISVRAESMHGKRLNPRKADLQRWRETFSEKLRDRGIDAEATRQASRCASRNYEPLWRVKARDDGRLRTTRPALKQGNAARESRTNSLTAWRQIGAVLAASGQAGDRTLAQSIARFLSEQERQRAPERESVEGQARTPGHRPGQGRSAPDVQPGR